MSGQDDEAGDGIEARLAAVIAKRGYLLPHHGLMAVAMPDLLAGYDAAYTALTLTPRHLDDRTKEFVWLAILTAVEEVVTTHHVTKFQQAGGTDAEIELAVRLGGFREVGRRIAFAAEHWARHMPGYERAGAYRRALAALTSDLPVAAGWIEMAMAAASACRQEWWALGEHISGAYAAGVPEDHLAEALSLTMFPGSVPNFVDACRVWREMVRDGAVPASARYRRWAELSGPRE
ncbi:carboxymuconolactone decarboxylase family protein [Falsiroseomonas sp.]|uniref:carboxymuconolactone decarboxylase family protein n=1 Tax=Falsiroseomonas sp. TaxID=2870721 RepID=UPI003562AE22